MVCGKYLAYWSNTCSISLRPLFLPDVFSLLWPINLRPSFNIFSPHQGRSLSRRSSNNPAATWWGLGPITVLGLICTTWPWPMASCECRRMGGTTCTHRWAHRSLTPLNWEVAMLTVSVSLRRRRWCHRWKKTCNTSWLPYMKTQALICTGLDILRFFYLHVQHRVKYSDQYSDFFCPIKKPLECFEILAICG